MESRAPAPTLRLHHGDTYLFTFEAEILDVREDSGGGLSVALDRTAFYPESGGQPSDRGILAGREVNGLSEESGVVWHALGPEIGLELRRGLTVHGEIDADLRLDHMQQHTGQHILSAAFVKIGDRPTVSFHLGREESTIDLSGPPLEADDLRAVEEEANASVLRDVPIRIHAVPRSELDRFPLRREPGEEHEILRVIEIEGIDWSACGGTHARRTGEVGPIHILGMEKSKNLRRVRFLAGKRALCWMAEAHAVLEAVAREGSIRFQDLPEAARAWKEASASAEREVRALRSELGRLEGERLFAASGPDPDGVRRIGLILESAATEQIRAMANAITASGPAMVLIGGRSGDRSLWVAARSEKLPERTGDWNAAQALRAFLAPLGGNGGGSAFFAQGTSPSEAGGDPSGIFRRD